MAGSPLVTGTAGEVDDRLLDPESADDPDERRGNGRDGVDTSPMGTKKPSYEDPGNGTESDSCDARCGRLTDRRNICCPAVQPAFSPPAPPPAIAADSGNFNSNLGSLVVDRIDLVTES